MTDNLSRLPLAVTVTQLRNSSLPIHRLGHHSHSSRPGAGRSTDIRIECHGSADPVSAAFSAVAEESRVTYAANIMIHRKVY